VTKDQPPQNEEGRGGQDEDCSDFLFVADGLVESKERSSEEEKNELQLEWMSVASVSSV